MARKTVLKHMLSTYAPLSTELQDAIVADNEDSTISNKKEMKDVTQEPVAETLDGIMGAPEEVAEKPKKEVINQELTTTDTSYLADEVPDFDQETGKVIDKDPETGQMDMLEGEDF